MNDAPLVGPSQGADGTAHMAYYKDGWLSFVWAGNVEEDVQVCPYGYGEPPEWNFNIREFTAEFQPDLAPRLSVFYTPQTVLQQYQAACDNWYDAQANIEGTRIAEIEGTFVGKVDTAPPTCGACIDLLPGEKAYWRSAAFEVTLLNSESLDAVQWLCQEHVKPFVGNVEYSVEEI